MNVKIKANILVMFSGGVDSTAVLWKLLCENEKIHIHHMNLKNKENRSNAEKIAVENILNYLKNYEFSYSESTHEYPSINSSFIWDSDLTSFMAGYICSCSNSIKKVALGLNSTDLESGNVPARIEKSTKIFSAFTNAEKIYPIKSMNKKEVYEFLPEDLRKLCWYCRTPIYTGSSPEPCNRCKTCRQMKIILQS